MFVSAITGFDPWVELVGYAPIGFASEDVSCRLATPWAVSHFLMVAMLLLILLQWMLGCAMIAFVLTHICLCHGDFRICDDCYASGDVWLYDGLLRIWRCYAIPCLVSHMQTFGYALIFFTYWTMPWLVSNQEMFGDAMIIFSSGDVRLCHDMFYIWRCWPMLWSVSHLMMFVYAWFVWIFFVMLYRFRFKCRLAILWSASHVWILGYAMTGFESGDVRQCDDSFRI